MATDTFYSKADVDGIVAQVIWFVIYNRGTSTWPARPTGAGSAMVIWQGPVQPGGMAVNDMWAKTST